MQRFTFSLSRSLFVLLGCCVAFIMIPLAASANTKTLTIEGSNPAYAGTLEMPESVQLNVTVNTEGVVLSMPSFDIRLRCLGDVTDDGYCYVGAGSGGSSIDTSDRDNDGVIGEKDQCANTPVNAPYTNMFGCYCPESGVREDGCPRLRYSVTASASTGGAISPASRTIDAGQTAQFTVTADSGYVYRSMGGTCPDGTKQGNVYTTGAISSDCTVIAQFQTDGVNAEYCQDTPADVYCNPTMQDNGSTTLGGTLDDWAALSGGKLYSTVPARKIVALPFTANAIGKRGYLYFITNDTLPPSYKWRAWYSVTPGGDVITGGTCEIKINDPNPADIPWGQLSTPNGYDCDLGSTARTLYFNMEVGCYGDIIDPKVCSAGDRYGTDFYVNIQPVIP